MEVEITQLLSLIQYLPDWALVPVAYGAGGLYVLWLFYLAAMNLIRAKETGKLTKASAVFGYPLVAVAGVIDAIVNWTVMTVLLLELPREFLVTARLKRHIKSEQRTWRFYVARYICHNLLDAFDPSGSHCC